MMTFDQKLISDLLTPEAVRERCHEVYDMAVAEELEHFRFHHENLQLATDLVIREIEKNYPDGKVPFHSRWRHFELGKYQLWDKIAASLTKLSNDEIARRRIDLAFISVLLDAGAGAHWRYKDTVTGLNYNRSEGLAIASIRLMETGALSQFGKDDPIRVDASALRELSADRLAKEFQVSEANPLIGIKDRTHLLNRLGKILQTETDIFERGDEFRPGNIFDYLAKYRVNGALPAREILIALLRGIGQIWPDGECLGDVALGDVGYHPAIRRDNITNGVLPFHKLSQWMAYSLIEPLVDAGVKVVDLDGLTGLAEYRNGGLFIDTGTLSLRQPKQANAVHDPKSQLIVEWRALTVSLLDKLAESIRQNTGKNAVTLPLASVLQGGTWIAGRQIAKKLRADGGPPLNIKSSGTIF